MNISTMVFHGGCEVNTLLKRQQELVTQLRALILPALRQADDRSAELAIRLLDDIMDCIAGIRRLPVRNSQAGGPVVSFNVDDSMISNVGQKRRRSNNENQNSRSLVTVVPHYDGHQWRKYGHKSIKGRQYARSYYRCAYTEQNCSATKTIQQQDHDGTLGYDEETARYNVVYYGHHTCKIEDDTTNGATKKNNTTDQIPSGEMLENDTTNGGAVDFQEFDQGDLNVLALLEVMDDTQLDWDINYY